MYCAIRFRLVIVSFPWLGQEDAKRASPWVRNVLIFVVFDHDGSGYLFNVAPCLLYDDRLQSVGTSCLEGFKGTDCFFIVYRSLFIG